MAQVCGLVPVPDRPRDLLPRPGDRAHRLRIRRDPNACSSAPLPDHELVLKGVHYDDVEDPATAVLLREKRQFRADGRLVAHLDGAVEFVEEEEEGTE